MMVFFDVFVKQLLGKVMIYIFICIMFIFMFRCFYIYNNKKSVYTIYIYDMYLSLLSNVNISLSPFLFFSHLSRCPFCWSKKI